MLTLQGEGRSMDLTCELLLRGHLCIKFLVTLCIRPDNFGDIRWKWFFMFTDSSMYYPAIMQSCIRSIRGREVHILTAWEILKQCHYCCEAEIWYLCKIFHCLSTLFLAIYLLHTLLSVVCSSGKKEQKTGRLQWGKGTELMQILWCIIDLIFKTHARSFWLSRIATLRQVEDNSKM